MNINTLIGIIVAVVVVGGGAYWFMNSSSNNDGAMMGEENEESENTNGESMEFSGNMSDLLARTGNFTCSVSSSDPNAVSEGTVYVSNGKVRGDFASKVDEAGLEMIQSHMINDGEWIYTWSSAMDQGIKMKNVVASGSGSANTGMEGSSYSPDKSYSYRCESWDPDEGLFTPPKNVSFMTPPSIPSIPAY